MYQKQSSVTTGQINGERAKEREGGRWDREKEREGGSVESLL